MQCADYSSVSAIHVGFMLFLESLPYLLSKLSKLNNSSSRRGKSWFLCASLLQCYLCLYSSVKHWQSYNLFIVNRGPIRLIQEYIPVLNQLWAPFNCNLCILAILEVRTLHSELCNFHFYRLECIRVSSIWCNYFSFNGHIFNKQLTFPVICIRVCLWHVLVNFVKNYRPSGPDFIRNSLVPKSSPLLYISLTCI